MSLLLGKMGENMAFSLGFVKGYGYIFAAETCFPLQVLTLFLEACLASWKLDTS